jgi:hypothetical protein
MIACTKCGFRNEDGAEFCANPSCGAYLGYVGEKVATHPGAVTLLMAPAMITAQPGAMATSEIRVRNKSNIVDQYEIVVVGEARQWTVIEPNLLSLFPDKEGVATVRFSPPRSSEVRAGRKPFDIVVQSKASPDISAHQEGTIEVGAFHDPSIAITPRTGRGGESATYRLLLQNKGNAALQATLDGSDPDDLLAFTFDQPTVVLEPGAMVNAQLQVNARATFYDGPPQPHAFKVQLNAGGLPPTAADATFLQEAIPRPVPRKFPVVPAVVGLLLLGFLTAAVIERDPLIQLVSGKTVQQTNANTGGGQSGKPSTSPTPTPSPSVTVTPSVELVAIPNVTCMTAAAAQQTIEAAGFKFAGSFVANAGYAKDVAFKTEPLAGGMAPKGSEVTTFISTGPSPGVFGINQCINIIRVPLLPGTLQLHTASPSP